MAVTVQNPRRALRIDADKPPVQGGKSLFTRLFIESSTYLGISRGQAVHEGGSLSRVATRLRLATETVTRLTDCEVSFVAFGEAIVTGPLEDDLVAVTWESLTNAIRHGGATKVGVDLRAENGTLSLDVTDNGRWATSTDSASSGLAGLHDRAIAWQGRAVVDHGGEVTRVIWRVPLDATGRPLTRG